MPTAPADLRRAAAMAAPLVAFFLIQNLAGLAVLTRVGRLGESALAGVGLAGAIFMGLLALLYGVDVGVQAAVARAAGAGDQGRAAEALAEGLVIGAPLGAVLAAVTAFLAPHLLPALTAPAAAAAGAANLEASAPSILALGLTIPMNAYWIATGAPRVSLTVSAASCAVNVAAAWILTPAWGAGGAGAAASVGAFAALALQGFAMALLRGWTLWAAARPRLAGVVAVARIGWPVSVQQAIMQLVLMAAFAIIARLGVRATAAASVLSSLALFPTQLCAGMGVATAVLVGQALGRGAPAEARRWGWRMAGWGAAAMAALGLLGLLAPGPLLGLFIHDPATVRLATPPARLVGAMLGIDAFGKILGYGLRGAGATAAATAVPFLFEAVLQLPLLWWAGLTLALGLTGMIGAQFAMVAATGAVLAVIWRGEGWTRVRIAGLTAAPAGVTAAARVLVLGGAGAGKSTFARALGQRTGAPVVHLDRCVYGPGWTPLDPAEQRRRVAEQASGEAWVVEGVYPELLEPLLGRAQLVVWLDQPLWRRLFRSWRKTRSGRARPRADRPDGCEEAFGLSYVRQIMAFGGWSARVERRLHRAAPAAELVVLRGDQEAAAFLAQTAGHAQAA